jgi:hypothetical protein
MPSSATAFCLEGTARGSRQPLCRSQGKHDGAGGLFTLSDPTLTRPHRDAGLRDVSGAMRIDILDHRSYRCESIPLSCIAAGPFSPFSLPQQSPSTYFTVNSASAASDLLVCCLRRFLQRAHPCGLNNPGDIERVGATISNNGTRSSGSVRARHLGKAVGALLSS